MDCRRRVNTSRDGTAGAIARRGIGEIPFYEVRDSLRGVTSLRRGGNGVLMFKFVALRLELELGMTSESRW